MVPDSLKSSWTNWEYFATHRVGEVTLLRLGLAHSLPMPEVAVCHSGLLVETLGIRYGMKEGGRKADRWWDEEMESARGVKNENV